MYFKWNIDVRQMGKLSVIRYTTNHHDTKIHGVYGRTTIGKLINPKMYLIKDSKKIDLTDDSIRVNFIGGCFFAVEMEKRYFRYLSLDKKEGMA